MNSFPTYYPPINVKPTTKAKGSGIVFLKTTTPHLLGTYSWYKPPPTLTNAPSMKLEDGKASRPGASQPDRRYIYKSPTTSPVVVGLYIDRHIIIL